MKSPSNVPEGKSSLQCEVYASDEMPLMSSESEVKARAIDSLVKMKLCTADDIEATDVRTMPYGNVKQRSSS